jgi:hypothetical protein
MNDKQLTDEQSIKSHYIGMLETRQKMTKNSSMILASNIEEVLKSILKRK